jgi:energy-coupling factor transport system substrate-specific component
MTRPTMRWRTVDIVVAAVIAAAFGVVFWLWSGLWTGAANAIPLPGRAFMYGMWLVPGVLGGLIIRKPGAAFFTETVAAVISAALGTEWGLTLVIQGPPACTTSWSGTRPTSTAPAPCACPTWRSRW